jgi:hypothetical protein
MTKHARFEYIHWIVATVLASRGKQNLLLDTWYYLTRLNTHIYTDIRTYSHINQYRRTYIDIDRKRVRTCHSLKCYRLHAVRVL